VAPGLAKGHLDLELEVDRAEGGGAGGAFALVLHPLAGGEGAAVVFSWETGVLQVGCIRGKREGGVSAGEL
jgi:hypothetical protein